MLMCGSDQKKTLPRSAKVSLEPGSARFTTTRGDVTVNFTLHKRTTSETINVSATTFALQFNTSTRELTVDRKMMMDLPVKARNPFTLALLDPAVVNRYFAER